MIPLSSRSSFHRNFLAGPRMEAQRRDRGMPPFASNDSPAILELERIGGFVLAIRAGIRRVSWIASRHRLIVF
jgi:hypothetical protein